MRLCSERPTGLDLGLVAPLVSYGLSRVMTHDCEQDKWSAAAHGQNMEPSVNYPVTNVIGQAISVHRILTGSMWRLKP